MRSVPPVSSVRLSGKNATDHTGRPGPTSVRSSLRVARSMIATEPRMPAAAMSLPSGEIATAMIGHGADLDLAFELAGGGEEIDLAIGAGGDDLAVGRDRDRIERRRQRDDCGRAARERPDAQRRVIAGGDDRLAVGREGHAVDVVLVALEHARRRRRRAATAARCGPMTPTPASRRRGETASATTGALCPSSTAAAWLARPARSRCARPRRS